jgi:hypothetical protein
VKKTVFISKKSKALKRGYSRDQVKRTDRRKKKGCSKARIKRRISSELSRITGHLDIFNRIDILPEKRAHLEIAIELLDAVLDEGGSTSRLRLQRALCLEKLRDVERGSAGARDMTIEVVIGEDGC